MSKTFKEKWLRSEAEFHLSSFRFKIKRYYACKRVIFACIIKLKSHTSLKSVCSLCYLYTLEITFQRDRRGYTSEIFLKIVSVVTLLDTPVQSKAFYQKCSLDASNIDRWRIKRCLLEMGMSTQVLDLGVAIVPIATTTVLHSRR